MSDRDLPPPPSFERPVFGDHSDSYDDSSFNTQSTSFRTRTRSSRSGHSYLLHDEHVQTLLQQFKDQLQTERRRAEEAERHVRELTEHLKVVNEARQAAMRDAAKANEELRLYKIQLSVAQREITRAQETIDIVDLQRHSAEKEAARLRTKNRQLHETITVQQARDEAWRMGLEEGLERGKEFIAAEPAPYPPGQTTFPSEYKYDDDHEDDDDEDYGRDDTISYRSASPLPLPRHEHMQAPSAGGASGRRQSVSSVQPPPPGPAPVPVPSQPMSVRSDRAPSTSGQDPSIHPVPVRSIAPSSRPTSPYIPPDNLIPSLGEDSRIRLPPPFEFHRRVSTPEPQDTTLSDSSQEPVPIRPRSGHSRHRRRSSSSASGSTNVSQMDIVKDPQAHLMRTPMSAIPEVSTQYTGSPNPQSLNTTLRHQYSVGAESTQYRAPSQKAPSMMEPDRKSQYSQRYERPASPYNPQPYMQPDYAAGPSDRSHASRESSAPDITVVPPPTSENLWNRPSSPARSYQTSVREGGMPGGYGGIAGSTASRQSRQSLTPTELADDVMSSRMSVNTLTTEPRHDRRRR